MTQRSTAAKRKENTQKVKRGRDITTPTLNFNLHVILILNLKPVLILKRLLRQNVVTF